MGELDQIRRRQREVATRFTEAFADDILGAAQRIAPHDEGTLAASGGRETITNPDGSVTVTIFFATVYAARQHEELSWRHKSGKQAKYLETPFKAAISRYPAGLARALATVR